VVVSGCVPVPLVVEGVMLVVDPVVDPVDDPVDVEVVREAQETVETKP